MHKAQKISIVLLRVALGWLFLYAGVTKILDPAWSAAGYLANAQTFPSLFAWFALPQNIGWVNLVNEWGLTLVGAVLILGIFVRWASVVGIVFMALYYLPVLSFPYAGEHSYIIDEHIIYILALIVLIVFHAGRYWGLDGRIGRR
ncbi:DoxX family protein [Candidatus Wolfebacteria bacterium]|nr:DoxX family protein [Candidatus Wolfebacteria bacterium]